ncbi:hypothetical protein D1BOALGB6SA_7040 [Olavius sp. associated proteobacterium Delta 1]|nr:hypothetical protein D1BOALGB6SA_7040 [Olavius sp. associated proteobacterium Delta 1]
MGHIIDLVSGVAFDCDDIDDDIAELQIDSRKTAIRILNGYKKY